MRSTRECSIPAIRSRDFPRDVPWWEHFGGTGEDAGINLDGAGSPDQLREFVKAIDSDWKRVAQVLFPAKRKVDKRVIKLLGQYAWFKAQAMEQRRKGRINEALKDEEFIERVYKALPAYAKW